MNYTVYYGFTNTEIRLKLTISLFKDEFVDRLRYTRWTLRALLTAVWETLDYIVNMYIIENIICVRSDLGVHKPSSHV